MLRSRPLAEAMRPRTLEEFVGQEHLARSRRKLLRGMTGAGKLRSLILWGPPGSGKTTLAQILANSAGAHCVHFSAVTSGVKDLKKIIQEAEQLQRLGKPTVLFVDEIHHFNKAQQDNFLPHVERGTLILIGATTENPSFEVISPLLSRCQVLVLKTLSTADIGKIIDRALSDTERGLGKLELDDRRGSAGVSDPTVTGRLPRRAQRLGNRRDPARKPDRQNDHRLWPICKKRCKKNRCNTTKPARSITTSSRLSSKACAAAIRMRRFTG